MKNSGTGLVDYANGQLYYGLKTGLNEAFEIDQSNYDRIVQQSPASNKLIHQFLGGQDIRRYYINDKKRYLIVIPAGWTKKQTGNSNLSEKEAWTWFEKKYKLLAEHLLNYYEAAKKRQDKGDYWWELRPCDYYNALDNPKIVYPDIAKSPRFYLDTSGTYISNTAYCLGVNDLYLLGILNSKIAWFAISQISIPFGVRAGEFRYRLIYQYMEKFPVRTIDFNNSAEKSQHEKMVALVSQMLELHKSKAGAKTQAEIDLYERQIKAVDGQIDALVYELYGLNEEEIGIVTNQT